MSVSQEQQQKQSTPFAGHSMRNLTVRTDSITLQAGGPSGGGGDAHGSRMSDTGLLVERLDSPSQHIKKPSASSISSTSSAGSKTAAFFNNAHADHSVRPAASTSSTSINSTGRTSDYSSPQKHSVVQHHRVYSGDEGPYRFNANLKGVRSSESEHGLDRASSLNSAGSTGDRRSWLDFDGKPIMPLPSPSFVEDVPLARSNAGQDSAYGFPLLSSSGRGPVQQQQNDTPVRRVISSSSSSFHTPGVRQLDVTTVESPKTLNFFGGARWSSNQLASAKEGRSSGATTDSPLPSRSTSDAQSIFAPSRFPSVNAHHPRPGHSTTSEETGIDSDTFMRPVGDAPPQLSSRIVAGIQPLVVPSAFISPPSPDPSDTRAGQQTQSVSAPSHGTPRSGSSRHTHGPSENASHSSILPQAELIRMADKAADEYRTQQEASMKQEEANDDVSKPTTDAVTTAGAVAVAAAEESEDEKASRVGPYRVDRVLGVGAFSRVVLAKRLQGRPTTAEAQLQNDNGANVLVALKMLEKEPCRQNERMRVSWVREVEVLKHVVHPNIVRFLTSFSTNKHHVLVLESVEGGELFEYLAQEQSEIAQREWLVRHLFGELANAVGWMHSIHLVHRDIKLENIILTRHFRAVRPLTPANIPSQPMIKLSDFGLSRFVDPKSPLLETRCGSEEYAAPELILGKRYDGRQTDVWAMGVVLYALLSGSLPFVSEYSATAPVGQGMANAREDAYQQNQIDARARKAHLLRIAKGDLRWPSQTNDEAADVPNAAVCPLQHRLITPPARLLVARLLRRDAAKRASAWDVWDESWMTSGSFGGQEASAQRQTFSAPLDPRSPQGQTWLNHNARVRAGAPDVVRDD